MLNDFGIVHSYWSFFIGFDIILIRLTGDCFINKLKLRDSPLNTTPVDFYPSINVMRINVFVFQTPDENRSAKEIGLECGFIRKMTFSKF